MARARTSFLIQVSIPCDSKSRYNWKASKLYLHFGGLGQFLAIKRRVHWPRQDFVSELLPCHENLWRLNILFELFSRSTLPLPNAYLWWLPSYLFSKAWLECWRPICHLGIWFCYISKQVNSERARIWKAARWDEYEATDRQHNEEKSGKSGSIHD